MLQTLPSFKTQRQTNNGNKTKRKHTLFVITFCYQLEFLPVETQFKIQATRDIYQATFSVGKQSINNPFPGCRKRASSGPDVININIPVGHRGPPCPHRRPECKTLMRNTMSSSPDLRHSFKSQEFCHAFGILDELRLPWWV